MRRITNLLLKRKKTAKTGKRLHTIFAVCNHVQASGGAALSDPGIQVTNRNGLAPGEKSPLYKIHIYTSFSLFLDYYYTLFVTCNFIAEKRSKNSVIARGYKAKNL